MFLALARQDAATLIDGLKILPEAHHSCQWLNFVRHHDELTLDRLKESEIQEIFQAFAPEENMQMWGRGIRRRLPPMFGGDRHQIELVYSLLLTLPGTPMLRYGEEIGMGDDLSLEGRGSVRTVMQWSSRANGGFSSAPADKLARPAIDRGEYGYQKLNVTSQQRDPDSMLSWMERAIRTRKQYPEFGSGKWKIVETDEPSVFACSSQQNGNTVIAVHNLSPQPRTITLKSVEYSHLLDVFGDRPYEQMDCNSQAIEVSGYSYRWFQVLQ
jgi:maltose alpha-D-glucosyltransferase/alpha-amylase